MSTDDEADAVARTLADYFSATEREWDLFELEKLAESSRAIRVLRSRFQERGLHLTLREDSGNPMISLDCSWDAYYSRRSRRLKKGNNHTLNRLERAGRRNSIRWLHGEEARRHDVLPTVIQLSKKSWKRSTGLTFDNPGPQAFISRLTELAEDNGWLSLWQFEIDDQPVAAEYQLVYKGNVYALRSDYDPEFEGLSPGTYLNWKMLEGLFASEFCSYSMGPGDNPYKSRWAECREPRYRMIIYNRSVRGRMLWLLDDRVRPLIRKMAGSAGARKVTGAG